MLKTPTASAPLHSPTRIVATIGPRNSADDVLRKMIQAGVDVFRFNMSHGTHEEHAHMLARVREISGSLDRPTGILVDLQGPKIRTRKNASDIVLRRGQRLRVFGGPGRTEVGRIVVDYAGIVRDVRPGDRLLLDDGKLVLRVDRRSGDELVVRVVRGGPLKPRAGVNVPGRPLGMSLPTAKDRRDARFAIDAGADFVAMSFVRSAADVKRLRRFMDRHRGAVSAPERDPNLPPGGPLLIAKIEKPAALDDLDAIMEVSDGVMVARGDLGVELSLEKVPIWQKEILIRARTRGKHTVTATQMLESMIEIATPTRAEVSDVANAILDGTDAVMLSAETASGRHPVEAVRTLTKISREVDAEVVRLAASRPVAIEDRIADRPVEAVVRAAVQLAQDAHARWIVIFTLHGRTTRLLARHRPAAAIVAITPHESIRRRLTLCWNTRALLMPLAKSTDEMMRRGIDCLRRARLVRSGDTLVLVAGDPGMEDATNLLRLVRA